MKTKQPTVFVIGAGVVATAMAGALRRGGVPVLGLWARNAHEARVAAAAAGVAAYASPPDRLLECDAVIIAVSDDAIAEVAARVVATGLITTRHTLIPCSGATAAAAAFGELAARVGGVATMHPLAAIAAGRVGMTQLHGLAFGVEGTPHGVAVVHQLVAALAGRALTLSSSQMARYHLAASFGSNFVVTLLDQAVLLFTQAGLAAADAQQAAAALAAGAIGNVRDKGSAAGLTGPIMRGDVHTVQRHLEALSDAPAVRQLYVALARATAVLAQRGGLPPAQAAQIEQLLSDKA
ncbi:MAG: DUF2520 domain-containing protein [Myxococcales bacterium]|nr:DUF2520 domain-containing protein [Myxococcales bacterium]